MPQVPTYLPEYLEVAGHLLVWLGRWLSLAGTCSESLLQTAATTWYAHQPAYTYSMHTYAAVTQSLSPISINQYQRINLYSYSLHSSTRLVEHHTSIHRKQTLTRKGGECGADSTQLPISTVNPRLDPLGQVIDYCVSRVKQWN